MQSIVDENTGDPIIAFNPFEKESFTTYREGDPVIAFNPFEKESFTTYREWEETLIKFMTEQSKAPDLLLWQKLITSEKTSEIACCCAMVLANLISYDFYDQSRKLFQIAAQLKVVKTHEFENWLRSGWLNIADVQDALEATLYP